MLTRIFTDADEDGSGWLTVHEFVEAVQQPRVVASLEESFGCNQPQSLKLDAIINQFATLEMNWWVGLAF